jgi:hypothetical protein
MSEYVPPTPGIRILCRDAEWLVTRVEVSDDANQEFAVHCVGVDDLVRGHQAIFLTQFDRIEVVDPRQTRLVADASNGYRLSKLSLEAQLRQMPATGIEPDLTGMGVFKPMRFQEETVRRALLQLRPSLLLKGLEFRAVAMACTDPRDPMHNPRQADVLGRCERYVAATRAREHLLVTLLGIS